MSGHRNQKQVAPITASEAVEFAWEYMHAGDFLGAAECFEDAAKIARRMHRQIAETAMLERFPRRPN